SLDGLEVGEHATQPAAVHVGHAGARGFFSNDLAGSTLRADEHDVATASRQLAHELHGVLVHRQRLLEVDDVNLVAMAENVGGHLGVPEARLVTEVDTGFQHFTHCDRHGYLRGFGLAPHLDHAERR